jgi:NAD(P)-dependent dehydrogenase (short-subunit alcohol dehydrogenase family)
MTSKAAVEQLGRALRTELTPLGASASVAYFGWVDTRMVQETFAKPGAGLLEEIAPAFLMKRITPPEAGAAVVKGIEERAPRIFAPRWWRFASALRGLMNPLLDRRTERDPRIAAAIRSAEERVEGEKSGTTAG